MGQPFYEEGIYTDSLVSIHGCDSIETFELLIFGQPWIRKQWANLRG